MDYRALWAARAKSDEGATFAQTRAKDMLDHMVPFEEFRRAHPSPVDQAEYLRARAELERIAAGGTRKPRAHRGRD